MMSIRCSICSILLLLIAVPSIQAQEATAGTGLEVQDFTLFNE